jgi:hypothetical protein
MMYLVTYDRNAGDDYQALFDKIKECGNAWHGMQNVWFVESRLTAAQIRDHCGLALDRNDKIFVAALDVAAWAGFAADQSSWLKTRIEAKAA